MKNENQKSVRVDNEIIERMKSVKDKYGVPMSEQMRRGMTAWLNKIETVKKK